MQKIAVLIPCYNEELTVSKVIEDFRASLPEADIYIYDNNSSDKTAQIVLDYVNNNDLSNGGGYIFAKNFGRARALSCSLCSLRSTQIFM